MIEKHRNSLRELIESISFYTYQFDNYYESIVTNKGYGATTFKF